MCSTSIQLPSADSCALHPFSYRLQTAVLYIHSVTVCRQPCSTSIQLPSARPAANVPKENFSSSKVLLSAKPHGIKEKRWHGMTAFRMIVFVLAISRGYCGRGVAFTTHPHLAPTLQKYWSYTCTPTPPAFTVDLYLLLIAILGWKCIVTHQMIDHSSSLTYPACNSHTEYCHLWLARL